MDYKKKYEEALERAKDCLADGTITSTAKKYIEAIFPELVESEDERIRKALVKYFSNFDTESLHTVHITEEEAIAWLEKQNKEAIKEALRLEYEKGKADAIAEDPCRTCDHPTMSCNDFPCEKKQAKLEAAWSEEDEKTLNEMIHFFESLCSSLATEERHAENRRWLKFLKSLRPQPHWKPSEEQMESLEKVRRSLHTKELYAEIKPFLYAYESLIRDLQKLL